MRILVRVLVALAALLAVLLGVAALVLPRVVESDAVQARIAEAARQATGGELAYESLDVGLLPPRLVVVQPTLTAPEAEEPAVAAGELDLQVALLPLLTGAVVVDSLRLAGARVALERSDAGVGVQGLPLPAADQDAPDAEAEVPGEAGAEDEELRLAVRRVALEGARIELLDRTVQPQARLALEGVEGRLEGESLEEPVDVSLTGRLASGGAFEATGQASLGGAADLALELDEIALAPLAAYAGSEEGRPFEGLVSGTASLRRAGDGELGVAADLRLEQADLALGTAALAGAVRTRAELAGPLEAAAGTLSVDATTARLVLQDLLDKPAGTPARIAGPLRLEEGALRLEDAEAELGPIAGRLWLELGERLRARIDAPSFDVAGLQGLVLPLEGYDVRGPARLEGFEALLDPLALAGRIVFEDVRVRQEDAPELALRGALRGQGDGLFSEGLEVGVEDQVLPVEASLQELEGTPQLDVAVQADGVESGVLMAAAGQPRNLLQGPLDLDAALAGPLPAEGSLLEALAGQLAFEISPGTLRGVSFLRSAFGGLGEAGRIALLAGEREQRLERFYGDEFQRLGGTVQIREGVARSDDLRLDYGSYRVDLQGAVGLESLSLDLTGRIILEEEIDRTLADGGEGRRRVIPLAHVGGTLGEPRIEITQQALMAFGAAYTQDSRRRERWEEEIDERLGEGSGREVLRTLDEILGGGGRPSAPEESP